MLKSWQVLSARPKSRGAVVRRVALVAVTTMMTAGLTLTPALAAPPGSSAPVSPVDGMRLQSATPTLMATPATDPDGDPVQYDFRVFIDSTANEVWRSNAQGSTSLPIPADVLHDGQTYFWGVWTLAGGEWTAPSVFFTFRVDLRLGAQPAFPFDAVRPVRVNLSTGNVAYEHRSPTFSTVGGPLGLRLSYNSLSAAAKSTVTRALPAGWHPVVVASELRYTHAKKTPYGVVLYGPGGEAYEYTADWQFGSLAFSRPENDKSTVALDTFGNVVVHGTDGVVYTFDAGGLLLSAVGAADRPNRASAEYSSARPVNWVKDPVSGRQINFAYGGGSCPAPPAGFDAAPAGLLCQASYWDGTVTNLFYKAGRLSRIDDPGGATTELSYNAAGRLEKIRDELASDAVVAIQRPDDDTVRTVIAYDAAARAASVTLPAPTAADVNTRPAHSYVYGTGSTDVHVAGLAEPLGYARRVAYNTTPSWYVGQITSDTDATGKTTTFSWLGERLSYTIDPAGMKTTFIYDAMRRLSDGYGPADQSCFSGITPAWPPPTSPVDCAANPVPRRKVAYDGAYTFSDGVPTNSAALRGLSATYWANRDLSGDPAGFATGVGDPNGALDVYWSDSAPIPLATMNPPRVDNWSARFEGEITFPSDGEYTFIVDSDDGVRLFVNDSRYIEGWAGAGTYTANDSVTVDQYSRRQRIRIDYYEATGTASIKLRWIRPGAITEVVPGAFLSPGYGLVTATSDADAKQTATEYAGPYLGPERRRVTAQIQNPGTGAALNLRTETVYDNGGINDAYYRPTTRKLPGSSSGTTYSYYATGEAALANNCSGVSMQVGFLKQSTGVGSQPIQRRQLVDVHGRVVGESHAGDTNWACTVYDGRDRVTSFTDKTSTATAGSNDYSVAGQVTASSKDSAGRWWRTLTKTDLLGRTISYTDEHGTTTRIVYDQPGRPTATYRKFAAETETQLTASGYDAAGRLTTLTEYASGTGRTTTFAYDSAGRPDTTNRPNGVVSDTNYDAARGRLSGVTHTKSPSTLNQALYTRSAAGMITGESGTRTRSFDYDAANRLRSVTESGTTRWYRYDAHSNRCSTSTSVTDCSDVAYEYDTADRITQSPFASAYDWDDESNRPGRLRATTGAGGAPSVSYQYDAWDHVTVIDDATTKVEETIARSGRVLRRKVTQLPATVTEDVIHGYADRGDGTAYERKGVVGDEWPGPNGAAWSGKWTTSQSGAAVVDIQSEQGRLYVTGATDARAIASMNPVRNGEVLLTYTFSDRNASSVFRTVLRGSGDWPLTSGYRVDVQSDSSTIKLRRFSGGSNSVVASFSNASLKVANTPIRLRFKVNEGAVWAKVWLASQAEPPTWQITYTDVSPLPGNGVLQIAQSGTTGSRSVSVDNLYFSDLAPTTTSYIQGPDGLLVSDTNGQATYPLLNGHRDIVGATDTVGVYTAGPTAKEFGELDTVPSSRLAWLGGHERFTAHGTTRLQRMGQRVYDPNLGRFTQTDPALGRFLESDHLTALGLNGFDYGRADPVNWMDLRGLAATPTNSNGGYGQRCAEEAGWGIFYGGIAGGLSGGPAGAAIGAGAGAAAGCLQGLAQEALDELVAGLGDAAGGLAGLRDFLDLIDTTFRFA